MRRVGFGIFTEARSSTPFKLKFYYVGIYPESYLSKHTQPDPSIPKDIGWADAPDVWWRLVENVSWEA
jgi:hypothetical protein